MIATVTLNPALDLFVETPEIQFDTVLKASDVRRMPGGKGLNVSRVLKVLGEETEAFLLAGGPSGAEYLALARGLGFPIRCVETGAATRTNVVISEEVSGRHIKVNMPGEETQSRHVAQLIRLLGDRAGELRGLVLAGSLPPGLPASSWADLVRFGHEADVPVFVDTHGVPLRRAVGEKPTAVKINRLEMEELIGHPLSNAKEIAEAGRVLVETGIREICVTDGASGAVLVDRSGAWSCAPPRRSSKRPVGAGDCFMAGFASRSIQGSWGADLLSFATACGSEAALAETIDDITKPSILGLLEEIAPQPIRL